MDRLSFYYRTITYAQRITLQLIRLIFIIGSLLLFEMGRFYIFLCYYYLLTVILFGKNLMSREFCFDGDTEGFITMNI